MSRALPHDALCSHATTYSTISYGALKHAPSRGRLAEHAGLPCDGSKRRQVEVTAGQQYREGKNLYVPEMFATISEAIANAQMEDQVVEMRGGDVVADLLLKIFVSPGHYVETISIRNLTVSIVGNGNMQNILLEGVRQHCVYSAIMLVFSCSLPFY